MDVHGATDKDVVDVWDCVSGSFKNEEFAFDVSTGGITTFDTHPGCDCAGFCVTPSA
jgi:hypothetical protein